MGLLFATSAFLRLNHPIFTCEGVHVERFVYVTMVASLPTENVEEPAEFRSMKSE